MNEDNARIIEDNRRLASELASVQCQLEETKATKDKRIAKLQKQVDAQEALLEN